MATKFLSILAMLTLSLPVISQVSRPVEREDVLQKILESNPTINYKAKLIPKNIRKEYKNRFKHKLILSDPGSPYDMTDVIYKNEPMSMLIFSGLEARNVGFLLYESQGVATQCYFVFYKLFRNKVIFMEIVILKGQPKTFEDLKKILIQREYF